MKLKLFGVWLLATRVTASLAEYNKLCPDLHDSKHEINPGEWVLVKCHWVGSHDGKQRQNQGVSTPAACAELCHDVAGCTHSSWGVGKKCLLSGTRFAEREVKNSVLLVKTIPDEEEEQDECPEDDPYCDDEESCEEQLEESKSQAQECQIEKENYNEQLKQCLTDKKGLLQRSIGTTPGSGAGGFPKCKSCCYSNKQELLLRLTLYLGDDSHGTTFTTPNNKDFRIDCKQGKCGFRQYVYDNSDTL